MRRSFAEWIALNQASSIQDAPDGTGRTRQAFACGQHLLVSLQVVGDGHRPRNTLQAFWWVETKLLDALFDFLVNAGRVVVRRTRTREQDRDIAKLSFGQAATPLGDHRCGTADGVGHLLTCPVGMQVEEMAKVSTLTHPEGFHGNLLSWRNQSSHDHASSVSYERRMQKQEDEREVACLLALFQTNKQALSFSFAASLCQENRRMFVPLLSTMSGTSAGAKVGKQYIDSWFAHFTRQVPRLRLH